MTAVPTAPIPCTNPPTDGRGKPVKREHDPTFLSGFCGAGNHGLCRGVTVNGCGCVIPCRCTATRLHDHPHTYEEPPVVLPDPFTIPDPKAAEHPEAIVTPQTVHPGVPLHEAVGDWTDRIQPRARPWVDGTGEGGAPLEIMVRAFAMAAGDLHQSDDPWEDYDETALTAMLGILRASVRRAQALDALLVTHLHEHHPWGRRLLDGIGEVRTYRRPKSVKWDAYGTAYAVVDHHLAERGGEVPDDPHEVVRWVLDAAAIDYYRVGALEAMGLDVAEYRHQEKGTRAVDVPVPD